MKDFLVGLIVVVGALALFALIVFISALCVAWAWNFVMPLLWAGAPHLTWMHAAALSVLLSLLRGIVSPMFNTSKRN